MVAVYTEAGQVEESILGALESAVLGAEWDWSNPAGRFGIYRPAPGWVQGLFPLASDHWESFFLMIPPGGHVHRHRDCVKPYQTFHVPVTTNDRCVCWSDDKPYVLEVGKIYHVDRTLMHWSTNEGDTDRVHLLLAVDARNAEEIGHASQ
jgi:hypothetical protein